MRIRWLAAMSLGAIAVAGCVPRAAPPPPPEPEAPPPSPPRPAPTPPPPPADWRDAPLTAGDWRYRPAGGGSEAVFGPAGRPLFTIACDAGRRITLTRAGAGGDRLTVRTTAAARTMPAAPGAGGLAVTLAASDRFLDEMIFSRGRYTVEAPGAEMLILPTWPAAARVVEDCRA